VIQPEFVFRFSGDACDSIRSGHNLGTSRRATVAPRGRQRVRAFREPLLRLADRAILAIC
jgi:hypothetical protein